MRCCQKPFYVAGRSRRIDACQYATVKACGMKIEIDGDPNGRDSGEEEIYSITSSAVARSVGGMARPSALAVLRLMISSNFVGS